MASATSPQARASAITFGNQGGWLYGDGKGYDGAQLSYKGSKVGVTVGYGQFNTSDYDGVADPDENILDKNMFFDKSKRQVERCRSGCRLCQIRWGRSCQYDWR